MMPRPVNALVEMLQGQWDTTSQPLKERASILPLGQYEDGSVGLAWPGILAAPAEGVANFGTYGYGDDALPFNARMAFDAAGGAMTGGVGVGLAGGLADNSVGIFGGRLAKTADHNALARAEKMAAEGAPREQIWNDTGWFQGVDGKWRFEIDDSGSRYKPDTDNPTVADVFTHQSLFEAYPDLKSIPYARDFEQNWKGDRAYEGSFSEEGIKIHDELGSTGGRSTMLHELQHAIQDSPERLARGGNPSQFYPEELIQKIQELDGIEDSLLGQSWRAKDPQEAARLRSESEAAGAEKRALREKASEWKFNQYRSLAGETEARTVQKRQNLTADERRARPPWLDYDVPEADQIVRFANAPTGSSIPLAMNALERAGADLPMDLASRMARAREMGFDTDVPLYHGTRRDFDQFTPSTTEMSDFTEGVYAARDPAFASSYGAGDGGRVLPLYARGKMMQPDEYRDLFKQYWMGVDGAPAPASIKGGPTQQAWLEAEARKRGYSGIHAGGRDGTTVVFDPSDLRSVNAAFDPAKSDSANLLAANAPTGSVLPLGMESQDDDNPLMQYLRAIGIQ